jgi:GNAT superfamily N-acetyltransferase
MSPQDIAIRPFQPGDAAAFRVLNEAWIEKYFSIEDEDHAVLGSPVERILKPGGHIFMAVAGDNCVGCCTLIALGPGVFELAKMAVAESCRGKGIGRKILEHTIAQARALGATSLVLGSNTKLKDAIHLYESVGFSHIPPERVPPSPYTRANVFMEMSSNGARGSAALVS